MSATIAERVAAGAAFLDKVEPDWIDRIDVETLDLVSCDSCVCGQIGGDWFRQLEDWLPYWSTVRRAVWSDEHGFSSKYLLGPPVGERYDELTDAWRELIAARRAEAGDWP